MLDDDSIQHRHNTADHWIALTAKLTVTMSAPAGALSRSGLLYEGNYLEWKDRMVDVVECQLGAQPANYLRLRLREYASTSSSASATKKLRLAGKPPMFFPRDIARLLRRQIHKPFLARIPKDELGDNDWLLCMLRDYAQPFRFADLPPELRTLIYKFAFPAGRWDVRSNRQQLSPILYVSHHIRSEALPIFYCRTTFYARCNRNCAIEISVAEFARAWKEESLCENAKLIRDFELSIGNIKLYLSYSASMGLRVISLGLRAAPQALLEEHITETETRRKALGLQGEAIIDALIGKPGLWQSIAS